MELELARDEAVKKNKEYVQRRLNATLENLERFPKYFLIETIKGCNANCIMCPLRETSSRKNSMMDNRVFKRIADEIIVHKDKVRQVGLYILGEPLLDKDIFNKINTLSRLGVKDVLIASNGSLLTEKNIKKLIDVNLDKIYVSVDGCTKETYEKVRVGLNFETVVQNVKNLFRIRNAAQSNLRIRLQLILQKKNVGDSGQWKSFWQRYLTDKDELKVIKVTNWGGRVDVDEFETRPLLTPCVSPFGTFVICEDGAVSLCCADFDAKIKLGDINKNSIEKIWKSEKIRKIRDDFINEKVDIPICKTCNIWRDDKYREGF